MLPERSSPARPDEFIGRQAHLEIFREALRHSALTERTASFALLGDLGIEKSSRLLKLAATCTEPNYQMLPVTLSIAKNISDYMRFAEAFDDATLDSSKLAEWLFNRTLGYPYFLAFIRPRTLDPVPPTAICELLQFQTVAFSHVEQGKLNNDLAHPAQREVALLRAIAQIGHNEYPRAPFVQRFPHVYLKRLADKGLLIRTGKGLHNLYYPLFRKSLQQQE